MQDSPSPQEKISSHFKGKDALRHVIEAHAQGVANLAETHGTEIPGHISAAADAARETAISLLLVGSALACLNLPFLQTVLILGLLALSWLVWKIGRSAWLGWSRLERLHRVIEEERWEIEHHRQQEREELKVLYTAKGFEGDLLEKVLDVLMADGDRLLRVMLEEELGLSLEVYEHPLKQALGAGIGALLAAVICIAALFISAPLGLIVAPLIVLGGAGAVSAVFEKNRVIPAIVWNIALGILTLGIVHFSLTLALGR